MGPVRRRRLRKRPAHRPRARRGDRPIRARSGVPSIGVVGLGYVGLATALAFAKYGCSVVGFDLADSRRRELRRGVAPFHEPGLPALLKGARASGRFQIVDSVDDLVRSAEVVYLCVPTPSRADGSVDLTMVEDATRAVGRALRSVVGWRAVVLKSTAVPGTTVRTIKPLLAETSGRTPGEQLGVGANPEFLAEGQLVVDALHPARIVIGTEDRRTAAALTRAYRRFSAPLVRLTPTEAELVKYASNALLATKVSFANEVARLASSIGADVYPVMDAVGRDPRLGVGFLRAGPGFGGSCFGKDLRAFVAFASAVGVIMEIPRAALSINATQPLHIVNLAEQAAGSLRDRSVALLGLAFKADTSDVRESQAYPILHELMNRGARVRLHDPVAMEGFRLGLAQAGVEATADRITWSPSLQSALEGADLAIIQCDWTQYRGAPIRWWSALKLRLVVDARRTLDPRSLHPAGVRYVAIGRPMPPMVDPHR